jgi:transposase
VSIVMGLDQHRGQITGEWIDTDTGEVQRIRVAPADRAAVRKFLSRFRGRDLAVALEATTGWRFVVEELRRVGAEVHLAEPAETAWLRGPKKRAKGDRADARHLRELLMVRRLPESWIPPEHILDLRARVRLRHELSEQRSEWQQRIQATLYHHGCPQRLGLMVGDGREWLAAQPLPETARQQVTVALAMIDALDRQLAPIDKQLRDYARRQVGCKALMGHYGIGPLVAVTILAELGDCTRFSSSRQAVRYAGIDITVHQSDQRRAPGHLSRQGPSPRCAGRCMRRPNQRAGAPAPTATTTATQPNGWATTAPAWRSRASCSSAPTTRCASSARRHSSPHELPGARTALRQPDAPRPAPGSRLPPRSRGRPPKTERPQRSPQRDTPITHHVAGPGANPRVEDRSKAGRPRAQRPHQQPRARTAHQP